MVAEREPRECGEEDVEAVRGLTEQGDVGKEGPLRCEPEGMSGTIWIDECDHESGRFEEHNARTGGAEARRFSFTNPPRAAIEH